jgi:hypothetical protein
MFVSSLTPRRVLLSGLFFSVAIELGQLVVNMVYRYSERSVDINDVISNYLGVVIGLGIFFVAAWLYAVAVGQSSVRRVFGHIDAVFTAEVASWMTIPLTTSRSLPRLRRERS